ncbi:MAG: hypothetical protein L0196_07100 [candidate division Zixibacteria bacterium]|nr:hypothetical protein [candidate division Zixibacteria bacterium]
MATTVTLQLPLGVLPSVSLTDEQLAMLTRIEQTDFPFVEEKLLKDGRIELEDLPTAVREFKRFIALVGFRIGPLGMISSLIDEVWHQFILFTRQYPRFCRETVGFFIHHQPNTSYTPVPSNAGRSFVRAYERYFGPVPEFWFRGLPTEVAQTYTEKCSDPPPGECTPSGWEGDPPDDDD